MYSINRGVYLNFFIAFYMYVGHFGEGVGVLKSHMRHVDDFYATSYGTKHHNLSIKLFILYFKINLVNILLKCTVLIEQLILLARYSKEKFKLK